MAIRITGEDERQCKRRQKDGRHDHGGIPLDDILEPDAERFPQKVEDEQEERRGHPGDMIAYEIYGQLVAIARDPGDVGFADPLHERAVLQILPPVLASGGREDGSQHVERKEHHRAYPGQHINENESLHRPFLKDAERHVARHPFPERRPRVSAGSLLGANGATATAAPFVFDFYAFLTLGPLGVSSMT